MLLISGHFEMLKPAVVRGLAVPSELVLSALIENRYIDTYMIITRVRRVGVFDFGTGRVGYLPKSSGTGTGRDGY